MTDDWNGEDYQRRVDEALAAHDAPHGEADLVTALAPTSVLDAGCGTGRVAIELARRGIDVVGVDADASMIATARDRARDLTWVHEDVADLALGRTFDVVVMAGNVPLFVPSGTTAALIAGCARHLGPDGRLVSGFELGRGYTLEQLDAEAEAVGLRLEERFSTWERTPMTPDADYAVSVHRR